MKTTTETLAEERDRAAEFALDALEALRRQLDRATDTIRSATEGEPIIRGNLVPDAQRVYEAVTETTKFAALYEAAGLAARVEEKAARKTATAETISEYAGKAYSDLADSGFPEFGSEVQVAIVDTAGDALASDGYEFDRDALVAESRRLA